MARAVSAPASEAAPARPLMDRLMLRMPWLVPVYARLALRLPGARLKRWVTMDFLPRSAAALNRRDLDVYLLGFHPDVVWRIASDQPDSRTLQGLPAVRAYLAEYFEPWDEFENRPLEVLAAGPHRLGFTSVLTARGSISGVRVEQLEAYVVELRRGWVVRLHEFRSRELALEALAAEDPMTVG